MTHLRSSDEIHNAGDTYLMKYQFGDELQCCFTSTETISTIRDHEPRAATSAFTDADLELWWDPHCWGHVPYQVLVRGWASLLLYVHRDHKDGESRTDTLTFTDADLELWWDPHCWGHVPYQVLVRGWASLLLYVHRDHKDYKNGESRTDTLTFMTQPLRSDEIHIAGDTYLIKFWFGDEPQCCFTSTETIRTGSPGRTPWLSPTQIHIAEDTYLIKFWFGDEPHCCFTSIETIKTIRTGSPGRTPWLSLTQIWNSWDPHCWGPVPYQALVRGWASVWLWVHKEYKDGESRTDTLTFMTQPLRSDEIHIAGDPYLIKFWFGDELQCGFTSTETIRTGSPGRTPRLSLTQIWSSDEIHIPGDTYRMDSSSFGLGLSLIPPPPPPAIIVHHAPPPPPPLLVIFDFSFNLILSPIVLTSVLINLILSPLV